jgi:hypothetical protein
MNSQEKGYAGNVTAWDMLIGGDEIVALLDFMIERLEAGDPPVETLKALRERLRDERPSSWRQP